MACWPQWLWATIPWQCAFLRQRQWGACGHCGFNEGSIRMTATEPTRFVHRYLASVLALASHRISAEFHVEVKKAGFTVTEWRILGSLIEGDGETVGELARLAITKQPTLSKVLPRLQAQGLITLGTSRADRRQTLVKITPKGTKLIGGLCERAMAHQHRVLEKLDHDHADRLVDMLRAILAK